MTMMMMIFRRHKLSIGDFCSCDNYVCDDDDDNLIGTKKRGNLLY